MRLCHTVVLIFKAYNKLMTTIFIGIIAILAYLVSSGLHYRHLHKTNTPFTWVVVSTLIAIIAHALTTYCLINTPNGIDLGFLNMASLICVLVAALGFLISLKKPVASLLVMLFPMAIFSLLLALFLPEGKRPETTLSPGIVAHVLLSVLAYGVMMIAACQALLLAIQNRQLHLKKTTGLINVLPSMQSMEQMLFELLWAGFILLSLSILSGALYVENLFAQHLAHKTILTLLAWLVSAILLWGHHISGWRGATAVRLTLSAFFLLLLAYVGSSIVLQFILSR